jgi:hypothetical protein
MKSVLIFTPTHLAQTSGRHPPLLHIQLCGELAEGGLLGMPPVRSAGETSEPPDGHTLFSCFEKQTGGGGGRSGDRVLTNSKDP